LNIELSNGLNINKMVIIVNIKPKRTAKSPNKVPESSFVPKFIKFKGRKYEIINKIIPIMNE
jgi:hypothetical protein